MRLTLYAIKHSHPVLAARLMLRAKGLPWTERDALPGLHPIVVRMAGFADRTVPALVLGDRYVQGTLAISRALDELVPDPPIFGRDPVERAAIEAAERWGHDQLQRVAARVFRWAGMRDNRVRAWIADQVIGWPAPVACGIAFGWELGLQASGEAAAAFGERHPQVPTWQQGRRMDEGEREAFLARFVADGQGIGFAVLGGSFAPLGGQNLIEAAACGCPITLRSRRPWRYARPPHEPRRGASRARSRFRSACRRIPCRDCASCRAGTRSA